MPYSGNENVDSYKKHEEVVIASSDSACACAAPYSQILGKDIEKIKLNKAPDGTIVPDIYIKLPEENSYYISPTKEDFNRLKVELSDKNIIFPPDLFSNIKSQTINYAVELISMANNAGQLVSGFEKVENIFKKGKKGLYITAAKPNSSSRKKLESLFKNNCSGEIIDILNTDLLIKATGKKNPVHIFVEYGGLSKKIIVQVNLYLSLNGMA